MGWEAKWRRRRKGLEESRVAARVGALIGTHKTLAPWSGPTSLGWNHWTARRAVHLRSPFRWPKHITCGIVGPPHRGPIGLSPDIIGASQEGVLGYLGYF